jgi:hypothetical protein
MPSTSSPPKISCHVLPKTSPKYHNSISPNYLFLAH